MSNIEWTNETWNCVSGCTRASAGCDNCYAVMMTHRLESMGQKKYAGLTVLNAKGDRHFTGEVRCHEDRLAIPLRWRKPRKVFVNSMSDLFHRDVPFDFIDRVFAVMALCPQHTFQVLTKRPERMAEYLAHEHRDTIIDYHRVVMWREWHDADHVPWTRDLSRLPVTTLPLPNVWLGTSVEDQVAADTRIPHLLRCPAAVRFLSCEPLLGAVELNIDGDCSDWSCPACGSRAVDRDFYEDDVSGWSCPDCGEYSGPGPDPDWKPLLDWVIVGGESGHDARPCNIDWIRSIVQQCRAAGVPCFVKQLGAEPRGLDCAECGNAGEVVAGRNELSMAICPRCDGTDRVHLRSRKGGDPAEWPEDMRVREFPVIGGAA